MNTNIEVLRGLRERLVRINNDTDGDNHINESCDALDELDAALAAMAAQPEAQGAVAWQRRSTADNGYQSKWSEWCPDEHPDDPFPKTTGRWTHEYRALYTAAPKPAGGDDRVARMLRCLGLDGVEELPNWGWSYNRQTCTVEAMIENGTLFEHFDEWLNTLTAAQQQENTK